MAKGTVRSTFKDGVLKPASGESDLEFEGKVELLEGDAELNGHKFVIGIGPNDVDFENL